jgi:hypothetical protein
MNPAGRQLHHEQHIQALEQDRVDMEEVARHNPSACADRNCRHVSPRGGCRVDAGPLRTSHTVLGATVDPSRTSSPWMRR